MINSICVCLHLYISTDDQMDVQRFRWVLKMSKANPRIVALLSDRIQQK